MTVGNGHDGTPTDGIEHITSGQLSGTGAYYMDGTYDYVNIGNIQLGDSFTLSIWVKGNTVSNESEYNWQNLFLKFYSVSCYIGGTREIQWYNSNGSTWGSYENFDSHVLDGNWNHLAFTYDSGQLTIYVNGEKKGSKAVTYGDSDRDFYVGNHYTGVTRVDYAMDEFRIYNRALSETEVQDLYVGGETLKCGANMRIGTILYMTSDNNEMPGRVGNPDGNGFLNFPYLQLPCAIYCGLGLGPLDLVLCTDSC